MGYGMKLLFAVTTAICFFHGPIGLSSEYSPLMGSAQFESDIKSGKLKKLAERTDVALNAIIKVAAGELNKKKYYRESQVLTFEWQNQYRQKFNSYITSRDIGDHAGLSQWLTDKYKMLETLLGKEVCKATHLSDMHTINHTVPIVFRPCNFPMDSITIPRIDEYRNHFSEGEDYYGLAPVVTYWTVYVAVTAASSGTGFAFVSGLIAGIAERAISLVTPGLSDFVFKSACGGK